MKHKTSELSGALLDAAVAMAEGHPFVIDRTGDETWVMASQPGYSGADDLGRRRADRRTFSPSVEWADGGPIIERERISVVMAADSIDGLWSAGSKYWHEGGFDLNMQDGPTALIAAMRAYVATKLGEEIAL